MRAANVRKKEERKKAAFIELLFLLFVVLKTEPEKAAALATGTGDTSSTRVNNNGKKEGRREKEDEGTFSLHPEASLHPPSEAILLVERILRPQTCAQLLWQLSSLMGCNPRSMCGSSSAAKLQ